MKHKNKFPDNKSSPFIFWHPHQKLWNWELVKIIQNTFKLSLINKRLIQILIVIDTFILLFRVVCRRYFIFGYKYFRFKDRVSTHIPILYFDLGTHEEGEEMALMVESILPKLSNNFIVYGFDASKKSYLEVKKKFAKKKNVHIFKKAFCNSLSKYKKIKLYHHDDGLGDSIYRKGASYEKVESSKFSDWLRENDIVLSDKICLLRMNIEGAEYDVLKDLVECGLCKFIDGYFGMWDDLSKIDQSKDNAFRKFLFKNNISSITFNGRDLGFILRVKCIAYEVETCIQLGLRNIKRLKSEH